MGGGGDWGCGPWLIFLIIIGIGVRLIIQGISVLPAKVLLIVFLFPTLSINLIIIYSECLAISSNTLTDVVIDIMFFFYFLFFFFRNR